jgi:hypothetical protein
MILAEEHGMLYGLVNGFGLQNTCLNVNEMAKPAQLTIQANLSAIPGLHPDLECVLKDNDRVALFVLGNSCSLWEVIINSGGIISLR